MSEARKAGVRLRAGVFSRRYLASLALCVILAGCSSANLPTLTKTPAAPQPEKQRLLSASEQREHLRILAA